MIRKGDHVIIRSGASYSQDMSVYRWRTDTTDFIVQDIVNGRLVLVAPRYGAKGCYGNGPIRVYPEQAILVYREQEEKDPIKKEAQQIAKSLLDGKFRIRMSDYEKEEQANEMYNRAINLLLLLSE